MPSVVHIGPLLSISHHIEIDFHDEAEIKLADFGISRCTQANEAARRESQRVFCCPLSIRLTA